MYSWKKKIKYEKNAKIFAKPQILIFQLQLSLSEITCIMNCSEPGQPCFSVNTAKTVESGTSPLKLFFNYENDFEDWLDCVSTGTWNSNI